MRAGVLRQQARCPQLVLLQGWANRASHPPAVSMPAPPMPERTKRYLMGLVVLIVLLLVIMPVLLYLVGWGVKRYTHPAPAWIDISAAEKEPIENLDVKAPARSDA